MSMEERVALLEREVADLKRLAIAPAIAADPVKNNGTPEANWIEKISGSMKDFPEFEEVLRLGREEMEKLDRIDEKLAEPN